MSAVPPNVEGIFWLMWGVLNLLAIVIYIIFDSKQS